MCGIAGVLQEDAAAGPLLARARDLAAQLGHRGPDGSGEWSERGIALAHCRLAILDPSPRGDQPMVSRDGRWVVVHNGEIYNHLELRRSLPGAWRSGSDAETLVRLLEVEGIAGVERLAGMFAFVAWDRRDRTLHLVRDRLGIKPLYYVRHASGLQFASEPAALAATNDECRRLDRSALPSYLALGYPPLDRTLFRGIQSVRPGEIVEWTRGEVRRRRFWRLPPTCDSGRTEAEWQAELTTLWREVIREHLLSDVPVGVFLSGGMDSGAVAVAVSRDAPGTRAFTARFREPGFDESGEAAALCVRLGLSHTTLPVDSVDVEKVLPELARHSDLPTCDSSALGTWLLCKHASSEVKVVLSGDGADEVFGGYPTHRAAEALESSVGPVARLVSAAVGRWMPPPARSDAPVGFGQRVTRFLRYARFGTLRAHLRWRTLIDPGALRELTREGGDAWEPWEALLESYPEQPTLNRVLAADVEGYLVQDELTRADRMSMAHGLELRVPFLDHRLVELAFRMPYRVKCRRGRGKRPIARWLSEHGCGDVAARPKRGFNHPIASWLANGLAQRTLDRLAGSRLSELFDRQVVERWAEGHRRGREDRGYELWSVLFLLEWADAHGVSL